MYLLALTTPLPAKEYFTTIVDKEKLRYQSDVTLYMNVFFESIICRDVHVCASLSLGMFVVFLSQMFRKTHTGIISARKSFHFGDFFVSFKFP